MDNLFDVESKTYSVKVNYSRNIDEAIKACSFDSVDDNVVSKLSQSTSDEGEKQIEITLVSDMIGHDHATNSSNMINMCDHHESKCLFRSCMYYEQFWEEYVKQFKLRGFRPAHIIEVLALMEKFPDCLSIEEDQSIVALGSSLFDGEWVLYASSLYNDDKGAVQKMLHWYKCPTGDDGDFIAIVKL